MDKLDQKYGVVVDLNNPGRATLIKLSDGTPIPDDEWILFRPQDNSLIPALQAYWADCAVKGCGSDHLNGITALIERVRAWRKANPGRCKNPD